MKTPLHVPALLDVLTSPHDLAMFVAVTGLSPTLIAVDDGLVRPVWAVRSDDDATSVRRLLPRLLSAINGDVPLRPLRTPEVVLIASNPLMVYEASLFAVTLSRA